MDERDRWRYEDEEGKWHYDWGPREKGYPAVAGPPDCLLPSAQPRYSVLGLVGTTGGAPWGVRSVGRTAYEAPAGMPLETFTSWRNGVSESWIVGPEVPVRAGATALFSVRLDALVDALSGVDGQTVTVTARVIDPANAWEDTAWYERVLFRDAELDPLGPTQGCGIDPNGLCGDVLSPRFALDVPIPVDAPTGTHLFIAVVTWEFLDGNGETMEQTARVFHPFDVILPGDGPTGPTTDRALAGNVEALAWLKDWEAGVTDAQWRER